ncbi:DUF397 domain-containing protein [Streptomyces sp. ISL-96]|uniref:DUF397 domain-containing protein n=1 Tax=unclassified Streptomyces TaxID=2593676 RepID=UPI001BE82F56|nr:MULTISPECIES: DUF397 domain-containing protein [unclassified Streptomyces]MBT2396604.1 DUF397 domain-containing protein [Streptomyces sp. ISL-100]MBT2490022.1 DUF397 domain-containing protein [Streptomyces sp. ISL-96]
MTSKSVQWQKSSFSGGGDGDSCVELASSQSGIWLRESDEPAQVLSVTRDGIAALIRRVRAEQP